jgi:class 3 adenylate cyclase
MQRLASFTRLIMFDRRGSGASDPVPLDAMPTWDEWADDLRVVMEAAASQRAAIFAILDAGPMALLFAATNPDRTTALVLGNTTSRFLVDDDYPQGLSPESADAFIKFTEAGWGTEDYAAIVSPSVAADPHERAWFAKFMRAGASPRAAAAQWRPVVELDLRAVLPTIRVPTLVLQRRGLYLAGGEHGRYLAEHIPGARFVELDGADSSVTYGNADVVLDQVEEFLTGVKRGPDPDRVLATVLLTDIVDSTRHAAEMGDRQWRELLDRHDELARRAIERFRGRFWHTTGDGVLATFEAPGRAIRCTLDMSDELADIGLSIRAGLHAGEVELRDDDIGGIAVHIAARVAAIAGPGEVLVSRTVTDLVAGSGITFTDRGAHSLKGVPTDWQLYLVEE